MYERMTVEFGAAMRWARCAFRRCRHRPLGGRIFICYRWEDTKPRADWLCSLLDKKFGEENVFQDPKIPSGDDYRSAISKVLESCFAVLVVIGPRWLAKDEAGRRRIDNPRDQLRREVEIALESDPRVRVIPVLVDGARMPGSRELPPSLARLSYRIACDLPLRHFEREVKDVLIPRLETPRHSRFGRWADIRGEIDVDTGRRVPVWAMVAHAMWRPLWANLPVPVGLIVAGLLTGATWPLFLAPVLYLTQGAITLFDLQQARCVRECLQETARSTRAEGEPVLVR
jgi:TIR domain